MPDDIKKLEMRITELENQLKQYQAPAAVPDISAEELKAYQKVSSALSGFDDWGGGINECRPISVCRVCTVCRVCRICRPCINECVCGPCSICGISSGGGTRFQGFGD